MLGGMIIRRVAPDEAATLLELWRAAEATPSVTDTLEDLQRALAHPALACFIAEADGRAAGSIMAGFDGWRGFIYRLAVRPELRRRGIARRLVDAAHDMFAQWGARRITALVETDHPWATSFWHAVGYVPDQRIARFVRNTSEQAALSAAPAR